MLKPVPVGGVVDGDEEAAIVRGLIDRVRQRGYDVVTEVRPAARFWAAEDDHQDYYARTGKTPYCHARVHPGEEERVSIEGAEIPELVGSDETWAPFNPPEHWSPIYDGSIWTFGIGGAYPTGPSLDVWFDAIVFSNEPIGC